MAKPIDLDQLMKYPLRRGSEHCDEKNADPRFLNGVESILEWAQTLPTLTPPNEWVSVEERLPKAEKEVRLFCITSNGYKYQCQGFYVPPGMHRDDSDYSWDWECCEQYDEDSGDYFVNPGWYESVHNWDEYSAFGIADKVTHWMPLPAPPKKEHDHE